MLNDNKRGQPINQKKIVRSASVSIPPTFDVIQRRDIRGLVDDRMKIIAKAYEYHVSQDWAIVMSESLQEELQKAQNKLLSQQEAAVKKASKGLLPRLKAQLGLLVERSCERLKDEKKDVKNGISQLVKADDIEEFYRFKFGKVSKEMSEILTESIINRLKLDMNELQENLFIDFRKQISDEFENVYQGISKFQSY
jgi:hypothetical protein